MLNHTKLKLITKWEISYLIAIALIVIFASKAAAAPSSETIPSSLDTFFLLFCSLLVVAMNAGFAMLESGFCRAKNAINILFKNLTVFAIATFSFFAIGFAIAFGNGNGFLGLNGFLLLGQDKSFDSLSWAGIPIDAIFLFHCGFAATAATIVSGAVAERIKPIAYLFFSFLLVSFIYPIVAHWVWANGWLAHLGFYDFAGSTVVHSVGGWAALTGAILLGPRQEKRSKSQQVALPGHSISLATLGCFILWLGWFGFNCGSGFKLTSDIANIALATNFSASAGLVSALIFSLLLIKKADLTFIVNGLLGGLVASTAGANCYEPISSIIVGSIAGILVIKSILIIEKLGIDDPVGAISVHLVSGIWGAIAVGIFANPDIYTGKELTHFGLFFGGDLSELIIQLLGIISVAIFTIITTIATWTILDLIIGIRVARASEKIGLDLSHHGMECYPESSEIQNIEREIGTVIEPKVSLNHYPKNGRKIRY